MLPNSSARALREILKHIPAVYFQILNYGVSERYTNFWPSVKIGLALVGYIGYRVSRVSRVRFRVRVRDSVRVML